MERNYSYEIVESGYYVLINGKKVIYQDVDHIPNSEMSYEENAKEQIKELKKIDLQVSQEKTQMEELKEQITNIELALTEIYEREV